METYAPIVVFAYNRPLHFSRTLEALTRNQLSEQSDLFIFVDGPKHEMDEVRQREILSIARGADGFKSRELVERNEHLGLARNIIGGVTQIITQFNRAIVVEDDLLTSPYFLKYINDGLEFYEDEKRIFSISGYNPIPAGSELHKLCRGDVYFCYRNSSWGFGTWRNRWEKVDWEVEDFGEFIKNRKLKAQFNLGGEDLVDMLESQMNGEIDSWSIRFTYAHFKNRAYSVYPAVSFVENIGQDGSGTHCGVKGETAGFEAALNVKSDIEFPEDVAIDETIMRNFRREFRLNTRYKLKKKLRKMIGVRSRD